MGAGALLHGVRVLDLTGPDAQLCGRIVAELGATLAPRDLKPIYARYGANGSDAGMTPVIFADGQAKMFTAKYIKNARQIIWRFR